MTFKHFFLQSFKANKALPPALSRLKSTEPWHKILDRLEKLKAAKRVPG